MDFPKSIPNIGLVGGRFVDENIGTGQPGSLIPAQWGNSVTLEILSVLAAAGIVPDELKTDQLAEAISKIVASGVAWSSITGKPKTLEGYGITDGISSKPQMGVVGAIADLPITTLGTYASGTTDKPPASSGGLFLRMRYPSGNTAFDIVGHVGGGNDIFGFRRVLPDGSYAWRYTWHDGNFDPTSKANLASPGFTGQPTAPTPPIGSNYLVLANTEFVTKAISSYATQVNQALAGKADKATTLAGYGISDAYTKASLDTLLNGKAAKATTLSGYGISDAIRNSNPLPGGSIDIHGEAYAFLTSPLESCLAQNCYWNGTNWVRHNTAAPAVCIAAMGGAVVLRTAPAGTGSIVWASSDPLWTSANATLTSSAGTGTLRLPNGWIQQVFEVTESTGAADHRYFPVSFPNECFGVFPSLLSTTAGGYANNSGLVVGDVTKDRFLISAGGNFSPEGRFRVLAIGR